MLTGLLSDLGYAFRLLRKSPAFTVIAVATLGLGIGANVVLFTALQAFVLRPLPFPEPERLVMFEGTHRQSGETARASLADYRDVAASVQRLGPVGAVQLDTFGLRAGGDAERVRGSRVTASLLSTLGLNVVAGRGLEPADENPGSARVALISDGFWQRRFGGSPDVVGREVVIDGVVHAIVGVLPAGIDFPMGFSDLWLPFRTTAETPSRASRGLIAIGRLRPGVSMEQAQADIEAIAARLEAAHPDTNRGWTIRLLPVQELLRRAPRRVLTLIFGVVAFVLLIACANVANLLLARSVVRTQEIAVRSALGASRLRLFRQVLLESLVLAVLGGALGLLLARWGIVLFAASLATGMVPPNALEIDGTVLTFTVAVSVLTGVVFGLVPAFRLARAQTVAVLREGSRGLATSASAARLQSTIAVAEVAIAVTLLVGAGVLLVGLYRLHTIDPGFRGDHVLTAELSVRALPDSTAEPRVAFYDAVLGRLAAQPGVRAAAAVTWPPMTSDTIRPVDLDGQPREQPLSAGYRAASSEYARAMGLRLSRGRFIAAEDTQTAMPVAVVNETFARRAWADADPLGRRLAFREGAGQLVPWRTVVGVIADVRHHGPGLDPQPEVFVPLAQDPPESVYLAVLTTGPPIEFAPVLRSVLRALAPDLPLSLVRTMDQVVADYLTGARLTGAMIGLFGLIALVLSAMGLFGVIAYLVNLRIHEFGIRIALGATPRDLLRLVLRRSVLLTGIGTLLGLVGGFAAANLLRAVLMSEIRPEPAVFVGVVAVLAGIALAASLVPLRRVLLANPAMALHAE
jgi:putative ABC transport system permease protein